MGSKNGAIRVTLLILTLGLIRAQFTFFNFRPFIPRVVRKFINFGISGYTGRMILSGKNVTGNVNFEELSSGDTHITGHLSLPPGSHSLHLHENGDISNHCTNIGPHLVRISNIDVNSDGNADINFKHKNMWIAGPNSIIGRSVTIADNSPSGGVLACGIIGKIAKLMRKESTPFFKFRRLF